MPTITNPSKHFQVVLDTGANIKSACEAVFGDGLYVIKDRANANNWQWIDSVRGTSAVLQSNTTAAETTYSTPSGSSVGWVWKANGTGVTNTDGSITSTVSANQTAGFSIVTYTGTGASGTLGHGLGQTPAMFVTKRRDSSDQGEWQLSHQSLSGGLTGNGLFLQSTSAQFATGGWISSVSSTTIGLSSATSNNGSGRTFVAYCFSEIAGYSKFGSYTGNSSTDGPFVYCGFRPRYVLIKAATRIADWVVADTQRSPYNVGNAALYPNSSDVEDAGITIDLLSNGFKPRAILSNCNATGETYIFAAFAEHPFGGSNTAPANAR